jgi:release factor glutamine methyltransferase
MLANDYLAYATKSLEPYSSSPVLDSKLLLMHTLQTPLNKIHKSYDTKLTESQQQQLEQYLNRRKQGEPIAYIIKEVGFWDLILHVTPAVLIPRPETELLVETILTKFNNYNSCNMCDLGTGSGAIAIAVAGAKKNWHITAADISSRALEVAAKNVKTHNISNITLKQSNWFEAINDKIKFDIIVANPPYIAENDSHLSRLKHEPQQALTSAQNGLFDLEHIITNAKNYLAPKGMLLLEHGHAQQALVCELLLQANYTEITGLKDLAGLPRATYASYLPL